MIICACVIHRRREVTKYSEDLSGTCNICMTV
ncbi:hypothetical protein T03_9702 [Trichinella britovi]|uniref:Uncharacterized protein n=1 Tax=Trichinella britovi TaxID=45882 RepID=A0A0V1AZP6_TRIBR|nr:hypothetical protein T03_9702 [Trichinella britovi]